MIGIVGRLYNNQVKDIGAFVKDAKYNGVNLLQQGAQNQNIVSNGSGGSVTVQAQDLESSVANVLSGANVSTAAGAAALLQPGGTFSQAEDSVGSAMNNLASNARSVNNTIKGNSSIMDATNAGLGEIVDGDLNRVQFETRRFQFRSSPSGPPWKVGTTGFKLDAV
jgi:flagellin